MPLPSNPHQKQKNEGNYEGKNHNTLIINYNLFSSTKVTLILRVVTLIFTQVTLTLPSFFYGIYHLNKTANTDNNFFTILSFKSIHIYIFLYGTYNSYHCKIFFSKIVRITDFRPRLLKDLTEIIEMGVSHGIFMEIKI